MSTGVRVLLYFGGLVVALLFVRLWLLEWLAAHVDKQILMRAAAVIVLPLVWGMTWLFYCVWEYERASWAHSAWKAAIGYTLAALWVGVLAVTHVGVVQAVLGILPTEVTPGSVKEPEGPVVAAFGVFALLVSLVYVVVLVKNEDSFWAERFLDFRVFALWFLGGIYLLISSKVLDPLIGSAFSGLLLRHLDALTEDEPKYSLLVALPAIALASIVTLWYNVRKH